MAEKVRRPNSGARGMRARGAKREANEKRSVPAGPLVFFVAVAPFLAGLYYEWLSCLAGLYLLGYLCLCYQRRGHLLIPRSSALFAAAVLAAALGASALWGVDHGMAIVGSIKFLPLFLFAMSAAQVEPAERRKMIGTAPVSGAVMTALSFVLRYFPALTEYFVVGGRLAGFFQYPNTFGLYLLLGVGVLIFDEKRSAWRAAELSVLLIGIVLTGSRTTLLLLVAVFAASLFRIKGRKARIALAALFLLVAAAAALYAALTNDLAAMGRVFASPFTSSTFLGRLLYWKDAVPVILKNPFGLGYLGYSFIQGSIQTGVYSVQNIHNEFLQVLLDAGWIPAALLAYALAQSLRRADNIARMVLLLTAAHSLFDFDLQFLAIGFIALAGMDLEGTKKWHWGKSAVHYTVCCVLGCAFVYFGAASGLYLGGAYEACASVFPGYTNAWIAALTQAEDAEEMDAVADRVLALNDSVSLAYSAKARAAYADGDFGSMIEYKQRAIMLSKYSLEEYLDYFDMLYIGVQLYRENGDTASADYCIDRLREIPEMLEDVSESSSGLAWMIDDRPELSLPAEYQAVLEGLT